MRIYDHAEAAEFLACDKDAVVGLRYTGALRGAMLAGRLVFKEKAD